MLKHIAVLAILILVNGVFSCTEIAILSLNYNKVKLKAEEGNKKALLLKRTLDNQDMFLSTIQIAISLTGLFSGAYAGQSFAQPVTLLLIDMGVNIPYSTLNGGAVIAITILLSYFNLVFGELVPKRIALEKSETVSNVVINPLYFLSRLLRPFVKVLAVSSNVVLKLMGIDPKGTIEQVTEEEIRMMLDAGGENSGIDEEERQMINNIFEFDDKTAEEICTHRTDISAIDIDDNINDILAELSEIKYSRIPVYEENIDNIIGILHVKDIMKYILNSGMVQIKEDFDLREILWDPYFVPTSKKSDELFKDMKINKMHICIVIDEYGGTVGIVTMEDLIEEIMGNIFDEYDDEEIPEIYMLEPGIYEVQGTADLDVLAETLDISLPIDEYETVSGFVISLLGRIPSDDEKPEVEFEGVVFKVKQVEDKRISNMIIMKVS